MALFPWVETPPARVSLVDDLSQIVSSCFPPREPDHRPTPRLDGARVLFVDDEPDARELVSFVLAAAGATVRAAASACEALALLSRESFDVLVSDIGMPGEDGYALMRKVAAGDTPLPAIALTAFSSARDRQRAIDAGFSTHLAKPIDATSLIRVVDRLRREERSLD